MNRTLSSATTLFLIFLAVASCSDNSITGPDGPGSDDLAADANRTIASIQVTLASSSLEVGKTTRATAQIQDSQGRPLNRSVVWSSGNPSIASVDSSGLVTARSAGAANVIATHRLKSGSAELSVSDGSSPTPPTGSSNEPAGMTVISNRPFNAIGELGWDDEGNGGKIIQDPTAPKSPSSILRTTLPAGFAGGSGTAWGDIGARAKTVYVSYWARVSANWQGHSSGINKQIYMYTTTDVPSMVVVLYGTGSHDLKPQIEGQNITTGGEGYGDPDNPDWKPNLVPTAHVTRGQWYNIELVVAMNTSGNADGYVDLWLDGVHITHYGGIKFQNVSPSWNRIHFTNLWGGIGGSVSSTMTLDWDHLYISGKN